MKKLLPLLLLITIGGCQTQFQDNTSYEYVGCVNTFGEASAEILASNLNYAFLGNTYSLSKLNEILLNPSDKKTIDGIDYYFFGVDGCKTTVPVSNGIVQKISVKFIGDACMDYAERSINLIGIYSQEYSGFTPFREEYCGFHAIYKKLK
jgi:hypothetical protein